METEYYNKLALHYSECNKYYYECQKCEREFFWRRIFGKCTQAHINLKKCMQEQRRIQQTENIKKSRERQEKLKEYLATHELPDLNIFDKV